jgi:hypothetical protein
MLNSVRLHLVTSPTARSHAVPPRTCLHTFSPTPNPFVCCDCCFPSPFQATHQLTSMSRIARNRPTPILPCCCVVAVVSHTRWHYSPSIPNKTRLPHVLSHICSKFFCDFHLFFIGQYLKWSLRDSEIVFFEQKNILSALNFFHFWSSKPWIRIRLGSGSVPVFSPKCWILIQIK